MRLPAHDLQREAVRGRHQRPLAHADLADRDRREHVQAEHRLRLEVPEHAVLQHQRCAPFLAGRRAFLGGLEDQQYLTRQRVLHADQRLRHAQQDAGMRVMAAGVHHADGFAAIRRCGFRRERQAAALGDRQRVHVGTQRDARAGSAALDHRGDAVMRDARTRLQAQLAQLLGHAL